MVAELWIESQTKGVKKVSCRIHILQMTNYALEPCSCSSKEKSPKNLAPIEWESDSQLG